MSSFVGHALAALAVYHGHKPAPVQKSPWWWPLALVALASAPDVDYVIASLRQTGSAPPPDALSVWICGWSGASVATGTQTIRLTHSLFGSLLLPALVALLLPLIVAVRPLRRVMAFQALAVGCSHVLLDLLVGVTPTALFWPLSATAITLPFGVLPSAGRLALDNWYLYRNLLIEIGALGSVWLAVYLTRQRPPFRGRALTLLALGAVCLASMWWAAQLTR